MSFVNFTPISGSRNEQPLCYLLEIDEAHILLDCGWSDMFNVDDIQLMLKLAPRIDCLLLSHADLDHLGALPFLLKNGLNCPIYSSIPTHNMGALAVLDAYISRSDSESFSLFNNHDIDSAFDQIHQLRYSQHVILSGRASGITITAHRAGHSIGGSIWKIVKDTDQIVYAVDYNHKKERHLNGTILHLENEVLARPSILITDAYNALNKQDGRKQRDSLLLDGIMNSLRGVDGVVIVPLESATRILELSYLLGMYFLKANDASLKDEL